MNNLKKVIRFFFIYGLSRTLFKVLGRSRLVLSIPALTKKDRDIGIIGCGQFGFATIGYFIKMKSIHSFKRAFDIDKNNQLSFEKFYKTETTPDYYTILDDREINTVYIASNHFSHTSYAIEAIKMNKTVYIEKPICVNIDQFKSLVNTIREYDANVFAGYNRPFSGAIIDLKKSIREFKNVPFTLNCFISGHIIDKNHWYRKPQEGTRICGNLGHWLDLAVHILSWRRVPNILYVSISYSNLAEPDDNISVSIITEFNDIISIMLTSRSEPFEGINETINFQYDNTIAKIDDFRQMTIWQKDKLIKKRYWPKDVGHHKAILQPFNTHKYKRDWKEVEYSTLLMLFISDMVINKENYKEFNFNEECWAV